MLRRTCAALKALHQPAERGTRLTQRRISQLPLLPWAAATAAQRRLRTGTVEASYHRAREPATPPGAEVLQPSPATAQAPRSTSRPGRCPTAGPGHHQQLVRVSTSFGPMR